MKNKEWRIFEGGECPRCGGVSAVLTKSKKNNWVYDEEEARCVDCSLTGCVSVKDSECADIQWSDYEQPEEMDWLKA